MQIMIENRDMDHVYNVSSEICIK